MILGMDETIELRDPDARPDEAALKIVLGRGYPAYLALLDLLAEYEISPEWRYYNDGKAWLCKAARKAKTIAWISARRGFITATFYIPAARIDGLYGLDVSDETKERIRATKNTGKSKGATFDVRGKAVLKDLETVMKYKLAIK
jgi:hypothetical protein